MKYELKLGNNIEVLKTMEDNSIDSIVTDPPYEIGFMGRNWDASGIAYNVDLWKECLRVLKPGGYLLAFGATRTYHRLVVAIEDSGFEIKNQLGWMFGTGFPKGLNIGKAIDEKFGLEREVIGKRVFPDGSEARATARGGIYSETSIGQSVLTAPASPEAKQWEGWNTGLKPAFEPICMAQKPIDGTYVDNILKWGVGALNIDGCRIPTVERDDFGRSATRSDGIRSMSRGTSFGDGLKENTQETNPQGRYPSNLIHDGSPEVVECFPETSSGTLSEHHNRSGGGLNGEDTFAMRDRTGEVAPTYGDSGSASRFFYCAKATKKDRNEGIENTHPTVKPTDLMQYLIRLVTPKDGIVLDPFNGSGSTGKACMYEGMRYVGIDINQEYLDISKSRIEYAIENAVPPELKEIKKPSIKKPINNKFIVE